MSQFTEQIVDIIVHYHEIWKNWFPVPTYKQWAKVATFGFGDRTPFGNVICLTVDKHCGAHPFLRGHPEHAPTLREFQYVPR